jgi:acetyl-CoA C-acetyltransferase
MKYLFSQSKNVGRAVYIVAAKRTAIGAFNGKLSSFSATELGGHAIRGALDSINLDPKEVD